MDLSEPPAKCAISSVPTTPINTPAMSGFRARPTGSESTVGMDWGPTEGPLKIPPGNIQLSGPGLAMLLAQNGSQVQARAASPVTTSTY